MSNSNKQPADTDAGKLKYSAPTLREVELSAREVLGVGCKTGTAGGPVPGPQCVQGSCFAQDSS